MNLKLDTRSKKPKVYSLAWLTGAAALVLAALAFAGGGRLLRAGCLVVSVFFLTVAALLLLAFRRQMEYNLYSYNTIIYFGFALVALMAAGVYVLLFFELRGVPEMAVVGTMMSRLVGMGKLFILLSFPFLLVFSLALIVSNLSLIRHEGFRPVNLLGVALALLLLGGEVGIYALDFFASGSMTEVMLHDMVANVLASVYLYFECMMLGTMVADGIAARYEPQKDKDFVIVLGCAIRKDGTPTPLLRGRLDRALDFARRQEAETGKAPCFVLSGGQGADECVSEAECMRRYLLAQGVPDERLILEDRSTDTAENMCFSKELILARKPDAVVAFSTTNYHVFRSGLKARRVKLRALGMGCRSKWYFWPNAAVREFVGLLTQHRVKQGLILGGMILFFAAVTWLHYQF